MIGTAMPTTTGDLAMALDPTTVGTWVTTPAQNFGMIFFNSSGESVRFASSEDTTATQRPVLTVPYVP